MKMNTNEKGITLSSLVITVVDLSILAGLLIETSLDDNGAVEIMNQVQNSYYTQQEQTQTRVNEMTNGWEDVLN